MNIYVFGEWNCVLKVLEYKFDEEILTLPIAPFINIDAIDVMPTKKTFSFRILRKIAIKTIDAFKMVCIMPFMKEMTISNRTNRRHISQRPMSNVKT